MKSGESSAAIRERVVKARAVQTERFRDERGVYCNAQMSSRLINLYARPDEAGMKRLHDAMRRLDMSARAYDRILKVARTIADLDGSERVLDRHIGEAITYRSLDRSSWGAANHI